MEKNSAALGSKAGLFIQHGSAFGLHLLQGGINIINFETDMMQSFAALLQKLDQARIRRGRLDQLKLAPTGAAEREKSDAHLLGGNVSDLARRNAQGITIESQRLLDIAHNNCHMIYSPGLQGSPSISLFSPYCLLLQWAR